MTTKKTMFSWLIVLTLIGLGISVDPHRVLTETTQVPGALNPILSGQQVIRLESVDEDQQVRTTGAEWRIDTYAGGAVGDNGPAVQAWLQYPMGLAVDRAGNLYIADSSNHRIRRLAPSGTITTIAGTGEQGFSGDGGPAVQARLNRPSGVAVDAAGNLYVADAFNHRIRRVDPSGTITTIAGTGAEGFGGDNGPAVQSRLNRPQALAVDAAGNLYIADTRNHRTRRLDPSGTITTIAGTGAEGFSGDDGPAIQARLSLPQGVAADAAGNLYIADTGNQRIRRVDPSGTITNFAGTEGTGDIGDNGPAVQAHLGWPRGLAVDGAGNLFIADTYNDRIRRVDPSGTITTIAGGGVSLFDFSGDDGPAVQARLNRPFGVAADDAGNLYVADTVNHRVRRVDPSGTITTIAGTGEAGFIGDNGPALAAQLNYPIGVALDPLGNLFIADTFNNRIRRVDPSGTITTIAGTGERDFGGDDGPAVAAQLDRPMGLAVDSAGNLYIADVYNNRIRRVNSSGTISTIAGTGRTRSQVGDFSGGFSGDGGPADEARLDSPIGIAVDDAGNLYIADSRNNRIRRVDSSGTISTIAGTGETRSQAGNLAGGFSGDGGPAVEAELDSPRGVAVDDAGNFYIADSRNNRIRRVDPSGTISTIAGLGRPGFGGDNGPAIAAQLNFPAAVAVSSTGNLYIADADNHRIRRVDRSGTISTIAGTGEPNFSGDNGPAVEASLAFPLDTAVADADNLFVADSFNRRIRILTLTSPPTSLYAPTNLTARAVSPSQVDLNWREDIDDETGFRVQRRQDGPSDWIEAGTTAANVTTFSDLGLEPNTTYHYRVQAFNSAGASSFSNQAMATTLSEVPPTVTGFAPIGGPAGTPVTLSGTGFLGAEEVRFNGVGATRFEVLSMTRLQALVPRGATSGPISVVTPGGTGVSADSFTVTEAGIQSRLFVPIVLRLGGQAGSFYTSELTLANRSNQQAAVGYTYTASIGSGSGTAVDFLAPGEQRIIPDAIGYLTSLGVPIGRGGAGGTLRVDFSGLSPYSDGAVTVRTSTPVPDGRAGLAYLGLNGTQLLHGPAWLTGLRQNEIDRSNVALQNAGEEDIALRVTVFSGDPAAAGSVVLPEKLLKPGEFFQYNAILNTAGYEHGYVKVERTSGTAPYYAYGVINDQANSDGSFVFPVTEDSLIGKRGQTLPVIVETEFFNSELTATNFSANAKTLDFSFVDDAYGAPNTANFSLTLQAGEQRIIPEIVNHLRQQSTRGIGPPGPDIARAVFATVAVGDMSGIVIGARTGSPGGGGQYGVFYHAVPHGSTTVDSAWIYGLQQNSENRSNLVLINTGEVDESDSIFVVEIYSGEVGAGGSPTTRQIVGLVGPRRWVQINGVLRREISQGYVQVYRGTGNNPFIAYGVINDGGAPGQRSGDGAFLPSQE